MCLLKTAAFTCYLLKVFYSCRAKKNKYLADDIDIKFCELQKVGVRILELLKDA